jgi:drug/metabolite transporter (DMT)-like permease
MPGAAHHDDTTRGVVAMVLGVAAFAGHDMLGKLVVERYPVAQMLALRAGIAMTILLALAWRRGGPPPLHRETVGLHVVRLGAMLGAIFLFFTALRTLPLADATAIAFGAPFVMLALSRPLLGERVPRGAWGAVAVGFAGVLVIVRPTGEGIEPAALLAVGASVLYALGMLMTRRLGRTDSVFGMMFWMIAGQFLVALLALPLVWEPVAARHWPLLVGLACLNLLGQLGIVHAFASAPVSVVAPFEYTALLWAGLFGFAVWGELPSTSVYLGAPVIIAAGVYATLRTRPPADPVPLPGQTV